MHGWVRSRGMTGAVVGLMASVLLSTGVTAAEPSWLKPLDLRVKTGASLTDAAFAGQNIALVWTEPGDGMTRTMGLSVSTNTGTSFQPRRMFERSQQGAVAICGGGVDIAFVRHAGPDKWFVEHARGELSGGG